MQPPPDGKNIPILKTVSDAYCAWHQSLRKIEKLSRYTLGSRIDNLFTEMLELILYAAYARVSVPLEEAGKMLGGCQKYLAKDAPANGAS